MNVRTGRIQRDVEQISSSPQPNIAVWPVSEKSLEELAARLTGPENSPFAGGTFYLSIKFPDRYPFEPPHVTFKTPVHHPNIDAQGRICLELLKLPPQGAWKPHINLASVLTSIFLLMAEPNPNDPLDPQIAEEFKTNRALFDQHARQSTQKYATDAQQDKTDGGAVSVVQPMKDENKSIQDPPGPVEPKTDKQPPPIETTKASLSQTAPKKNPFAVLGKKPRLN